VLLTHQGGGVPLRPVSLEIARCLHVLGAEPPPPSPPVRRWPGHVVAVDSPWPSGQACRNCDSRRLVSASCCRQRRLGHLHGHHPQHVLAPRPRRLQAPCAACHVCGLVSRRTLPSLSPWQASHCSRVRCSFLPIVIGPEGACGSSPSTTLRRPIASSIVIVERSSRDSIDRAICLYFSGMQRKSFSTALSSS
jgi:hypothetical protein